MPEMSVTLEEFVVINDYEWVIPQDKMNHDHIQGLIESMFPPVLGKLDLLYCLLEVVTLSNKTKIGNIYIYSDQPHKELEKQRDAYKRVIQKAHEEKKALGHPGAGQFNPTRYKGYYAIPGSFQYYGKGNENYEAENANFNWWPNAESPRESVTKEPPEELIEGDQKARQFCEYLKYEAGQLIAHALPLKDYPYHAIIIKPLAVRDRANLQVYPLGNIFLYFGTRQQKDQKFYNELISRLLLVWLHESGSKLVEEIQEKAVNASVKPKGYLPDLSRTRAKDLNEPIPNSNFKRSEFFERIFESETNKKLLTEKLGHLIGVLIPFILFKLDLLKQAPGKPPSLQGLDPKLLRFKEVNKLHAVIDNIDEWLIAFHCSRMTILLMHIAFELPMPFIHKFLMSKNTYERVFNLIGQPVRVEDKRAMEVYKEAILGYLSKYMIYPFFGECTVYDCFQERLYNAATGFEQQYLQNQCLSQIKAYVDPAKLGSYNKKAYTLLRLT